MLTGVCVAKAPDVTVQLETGGILVVEWKTCKNHLSGQTWAFWLVPQGSFLSRYHPPLVSSWAFPS